MGAERVKKYRIVLDTNCIVSSLVFKGRLSARFRKLWQSGYVVPIMCPETQDELLKVLTYHKFGLNERMRNRLLADFLPYAEEFPSIAPIEQVQELVDQKDAMFIRLTQKSKSDFLVSGDKHILTLRSVFPELHLIGPAQFIEIIDNC